MPVPDLVFRLDEGGTDDGRAERARLILEEFEVDLAPLDRLGSDPSTVSFGWWHGDRLVANVDLFREILWLSGARNEAFGLQAVVVRPDWRGRGLFRDLMTRALAHADARADLVLLATETPALYIPFGFRPLAEASFLGRITPGGGRENHRRLSLENDLDVALIRDLFTRRTPVSLVCSTCDHPASFFLKAIESPEIALVHLPDLDAVVAIEDDEPGVLRLLDVVAPTIPPLDAIAAALGTHADRAHVFVTPDRLAWPPETTRPEDAGTMVRGPFPTGASAVVLSPMRI